MEIYEHNLISENSFLSIGKNLEVEIQTYFVRNRFELIQSFHHKIIVAYHQRLMRTDLISSSTPAFLWLHVNICFWFVFAAASSSSSFCYIWVHCFKWAVDDIQLLNTIGHTHTHIHFPYQTIEPEKNYTRMKCFPFDLHKYDYALIVLVIWFHEFTLALSRSRTICVWTRTHAIVIVRFSFLSS